MTSKTIPWMVYYYEDEKRKRKYFASRTEAERFAAEINKELLLPTDFQISPNERYAFTNIKAKLEASGLSFDDLLKIIDRQVSERALEAIAPKMTKEAAIDRFIKSRIEKGLRNISIMGYEQRLPRYLKNYSLYMTQEDAQRLIDNAASPLHFKRTLSGFCA